MTATCNQSRQPRRSRPTTKPTRTVVYPLRVHLRNAGAAERRRYDLGRISPMQIDDTAHDRELNHLGLGLTEAEASELRDTLTTLLEDSGERHEHVSSSDFSRELTVWLVRD